MKLHTKAMRHILLVIFPVLLVSCASQSPRKLYPEGVGGNVFRVGQVYQSKKLFCWHSKCVISEWMPFYNNSPSRVKLEPGTTFKIVQVKKDRLKRNITELLEKR